MKSQVNIKMPLVILFVSVLLSCSKKDDPSPNATFIGSYTKQQSDGSDPGIMTITAGSAADKIILNGVFSSGGYASLVFNGTVTGTTFTLAEVPYDNSFVTYIYKGNGTISSGVLTLQLQYWNQAYPTNIGSIVYICTKQ